MQRLINQQLTSLLLENTSLLTHSQMWALFLTRNSRFTSNKIYINHLIFHSIKLNLFVSLFLIKHARFSLASVLPLMLIHFIALFLNVEH